MDRGTLFFPVQLTTSRIGNLTRLIHTLAICVTTIHYGDNPLLRPTGIQVATKCYATLQAMTPTNNKTVHQTSFTPYREQPRSTRIVVADPRPAFSATNQTNTFQPVSINNSKFLKATHYSSIIIIIIFCCHE